MGIELCKLLIDTPAKVWAKMVRLGETKQFTKVLDVRPYCDTLIVCALLGDNLVIYTETGNYVKYDLAYTSGKLELSHDDPESIKFITV